MKHFVFLMAVLMVSAVAQAAPKTVTCEEYIAQRKARAEKSGKEFDEEKAKKMFSKLDVDKDGKLTPEEQAPGKKKSE